MLAKSDGGALRRRMVCPVCHSEKIRRSRRRGFSEIVLSFFGVLPWRCESCETRFHARATPLNWLLYAHCPVCGTTELKRIAPDHVPGPSAILWRMLGVNSLRCEPCRQRFFSVRPLRRHEEAARTEAA
jgi:predicted RNA-binding Zn-ribbon protein involved in translation (DUF1610 family)